MSTRSQDGLTIVELLVALVLGLLIVLAASSMLAYANRSFAAGAQAASIEDGGRFALDLIERSARQTAFIDFDREDAPELAATAPARISGADDATLTRDSAGLAGLRRGAVNGSDVLALRFAGSGEGADGDGSVLSCAGFPVGADQDGWSIFYVATSGTGASELRCKYRADSGWSADAVVTGVDSFQVLYGLDTDTPGDGLANRFVTAGAIAALDAAMAPQGESEAEREQDRHRRTAWKRVASIKVALLLHGAERGATDRELVEYPLFGKRYPDGAADQGAVIREASLAPELRHRERRLFGATITLRNPSS
jgi:type IV pilus assembly protein PilW